MYRTETLDEYVSKCDIDFQLGKDGLISENNKTLTINASKPGTFSYNVIYKEKGYSLVKTGN